MTFLAGERLLFLLAVAGVAAAYLVQQRRRRRYAVRFTNLALLDSVAPHRPGWRRHLPAAALLLALASLVLAFARPAAPVRVPQERATILLAIDTSISMEATDVEPTRLQAAQDAATGFVRQLPPRFNVGLVSFSGSASLVVPPTLDRAAVRSAIGSLQLGPRTAIGEAVFAALDSIRTFDERVDGTTGKPPAARIVLMSDGGNTAGRTVDEAAAAADDAGVPVSTIAYGTPGGTVVTQGQTVPVPVDEDALRALAEQTSGTAFAATSGAELKDVYADIGRSVGYRTEHREVTSWFVGFALLAALAAAAGSLLWFSRLP